MGFKYPPISFMLYVISIFLIICFENKGTFFIWNTQENREKSFRKSYIRRVLYFTSLLYAFFRYHIRASGFTSSNSLSNSNCVRARTLSQWCIATYITNARKTIKLIHMDSFTELFAHVLTIFCTFATCACCAHSNYINKEGKWCYTISWRLSFW